MTLVKQPSRPSNPDRFVFVQRHLIPARLDQLKHISRLVQNAGKYAQFDDQTNYACQLAVYEACENIIKHGYGEPGFEDTIKMVLSAGPGELLVELEDSAPPFNPVEELEPMEIEPHDPPVGGLGLVIIHRVMDEIEYQRKNGKNYLRLRKLVQPLHHAH
ncbi:MAG: ATP-binding protein [Anaerolineales bacterium]